MRFLSRIYFSLYDFLTDTADRSYERWQAHTQIATMLSTGLLMWAYAFLAYLKIDHPIPGRVGFLMALIHLLSPLFLRWPGSISLAGNALIGSGLVHQATFAFYTGGFNSNILIWFGILPMLGGIILGKRGVITWFLITVWIAGLYLYLQKSNFTFINAIDEEGWLIAQGLMVFGWIFLSTILIYIFVVLMDHNDKIQTQKNNQIHTLIRVLCHDISNPLMTIKTRLEFLIQRSDEKKSLEMMGKIRKPIDAIEGIIQQVRYWEVAQSGKVSLNVKEVSLNKSIEFVLDIFEEQIQKKKLEIILDVEGDNHSIKADKVTLESQIFSNILSNAIKFSENEGRIEIKIRKVEEFNCVVFRDYGVGIPKSLLEILFDASKKTSRLGTDGELGTGFGMPIVKTYVEKFGGHMEISSVSKEVDEENCGTTFKVYFKSLDK